MSKKYDGPDGFILSEAALYSFYCQDVYPDVIAFAAAIPDHLRPLFLIPIKLETATASMEIASRVASQCHCADGAVPTGNTEESDLFGTKTFVYDDNQPTVPSSEPGSIFDNSEPDAMTHHQEYDYDQNIQVPTDTTFMEDVDITQYWDYPYRTKETPVRHSSIIIRPVVITRLAIQPEKVIPHTPKKIKKNARFCNVALVSYDKKNRVYTFSVDAGNGPKTVQASLSDKDHVALSCNCPFWRYNGPEFNAKTNGFMLGQPFGTAAPPDIRDPQRQYWLCKHAYAVLKRLDQFVQEVVDENWDLDDDEILEQIDQDWDRLEGVVKIPIDDLDKQQDVDVEFKEESEGTPAEEGPPLDESEDEDYDIEVDTSDFDNLEDEDYDAAEGPPVDELGEESYDVDLSELEDEDYDIVTEGPPLDEDEDYDTDLEETDNQDQQK